MPRRAPQAPHRLSQEALGQGSPLPVRVLLSPAPGCRWFTAVSVVYSLHLELCGPRAFA